MNDKPWFNEDCVNAFHDKQNAYCLWSQNRSHFLWEEYVMHKRHAQLIYDAALLKYNSIICDSLSTALHPHKWWSILKIFHLGANSFLPPNPTDDGSVQYDPSKMAEVFSTGFQNKQSSGTQSSSNLFSQS